MRETMCKEEYKEFCNIKNKRKKILEDFSKGKINLEQKIHCLYNLITELDLLKKKYDVKYEGKNRLI